MGQTVNNLRWKRSCRVVLLAATILSSGFLLAQAQEIPIMVEPPHPMEGQDVTLTPGGKPAFILCIWYRGEKAEANRIFVYIPSTSPPVQRNGPAFTGRETGDPGCSLNIGSLMLNDTGDYVVSKSAIGGRETGRVHIGVLG
ncbi:PREDICTED: carcinoembryonic antigen-related cell adhesion molecule 16-like [Gekko japonicus]|uniref:Carcinoembryonic antigen-related cell adhesion molecule 16-like n=1 Tax=Gekko japonicus TaxID=146911 RepID=A0ABM1KJB4_GEKJA|nr:PREDICTED: carcinoembryonic antigen-related cell adhesion molecule 16-like [Gekko japonicus]